MTVTEADIEAWRSHIGRSARTTTVLDPQLVRRFAAAVGSDLDLSGTLPPLRHWAFLMDVAAANGLGEDGHPRRGHGLLPPVTLARRTFASATFDPLGTLVLGAPPTFEIEVADVRHRAGASGDLVFAELDRRLSQDGQVRLGERQTIVYRDPGSPVALPVEVEGSGEGEAWRPGPVDLFRFSAVTFNSHRIHYDAPYATEVEHYSAPVVHGPFTAVKLYDLARRQRSGAAITRFSFRANAPLFVGQPVRLVARDEGRTVEAIRCDGVVAMKAHIDFELA